MEIKRFILKKRADILYREFVFLSYSTICLGVPVLKGKILHPKHFNVLMMPLFIQGYLKPENYLNKLKNKGLICFRLFVYLIRSVRLGCI